MIEMSMIEIVLDSRMNRVEINSTSLEFLQVDCFHLCNEVIAQGIR